MYSRSALSIVSCAALCIGIAACGGKGDGSAPGANGVPDVADASAVPDVKGGNASAGDAIDDAGLSTHDFVIISWALVQASVADYAATQGADVKELASKAHIHPDNVTFVREHRAEIEKLRPTG